MKKYHLNPNRRERMLAIRLSDSEWEKLEAITVARGNKKKTDTIRQLIRDEMDFGFHVKENLQLIIKIVLDNKELLRRLEATLSTQTPLPKGGVGSPHNRR